MTKRRRVEDVIVLGVPDDVGPGHPQLPLLLARQASEAVWAQWEHAPERPVNVELVVMDLLITADPAAVDRFQPAHDCDVCRSGNERAREFLAANTGRHVALANLVYVEVWP